MGTEKVEPMAVESVLAPALVSLPWWVALPDGKLKYCWDGASLVIAVYIALYSPLQIALLADSQTLRNVPEWFAVFLLDLFVTLFFTADILLNFLTGSSSYIS
jgi:hypothetical protein